MPDQTVQAVYFEQAGPDNTGRVVELVAARARELGIQHVLVASTSGATGLQVARALPDLNVTVVTHSAGFAGPNQQSLTDENRAAIQKAGAHILTCQHALGGIGRAVRRKLGSYQIDEIVAFALRTFCQGIKVCCEITVMAADAGCVPVGEEIIAIGGTGQGADAAAVIRAANAQDFFDLRVLEIICKPRCWK
jgi:hypothetical protein